MCHYSDYIILLVLLHVLLRSLLFLKRTRSLTFFIPISHVCYIYGLFNIVYFSYPKLWFLDLTYFWLLDTRIQLTFVENTVISNSWPFKASFVGVLFQALYPRRFWRVRLYYTRRLWRVRLYINTDGLDKDIIHCLLFILILFRVCFKVSHRKIILFHLKIYVKVLIIIIWD